MHATLANHATGSATPVRNVFVTNSRLHDMARAGTAVRAQAQPGRDDPYGKTGTTNDAVDARFAGFQAGAGSRGLVAVVVAVVWMGHGDPQSLGAGESGGGLALPVWIDCTAQALTGQPVAPPDPAETASAAAAAGPSPGRAPGPPSLPGTPALPGAAWPGRASAPQAPIPVGRP